MLDNQKLHFTLAHFDLLFLFQSELSLFIYQGELPLFKYQIELILLNVR